MTINDFLPKKMDFTMKQDIERVVGRTDMKGMNFDPLTSDVEPDELIMVLIGSLKNLRKNIAVDSSSKRVIQIANEMKRTSYLGDMEYKFVLALNYPVYQINEKSQYFQIITEYIDLFYDRFDVINDIKPYLVLFGQTEATALKAFARQKLDVEEKDHEENEDKPPSIKLIRRRVVFFKLNKVLGTFSALEKKEKLKLINTIMQTYLWGQGKGDQLTDMDKINLDGLVICAAELLQEIKVYEASVLNPINFMLIVMLEFALKRSPNNNTFRIWLMKIHSKLGLSSKFTAVGSHVKGLTDDNFEKFGAFKYSHYLDFGVEKELDLTCSRYEKYFTEALAKNKSGLVSGFRNRDFHVLNDFMNKNEQLENQFFQQVVTLSKLHLEVVRNSTNVSIVQKAMQKQNT